MFCCSVSTARRADIAEFLWCGLAQMLCLLGCAMSSRMPGGCTCRAAQPALELQLPSPSSPVPRAAPTLLCPHQPAALASPAACTGCCAHTTCYSRTPFPCTALPAPTACPAHSPSHCVPHTPSPCSRRCLLPLRAPHTLPMHGAACSHCVLGSAVRPRRPTPPLVWLPRPCLSWPTVPRQGGCVTSLPCASRAPLALLAGQSELGADGPQSPARAPKVKCGWMHLLDVLCAPPASTAALSVPSTPRSAATSSGLGSPLGTPASARAAAPAPGAEGAGEAGEAVGQQQQASLPGSSAEVERLLQDTSGDRKDMRALKESILRNLRRT